MTCTKTSLRNLALSSAASALAVALLASPALAEDNLPPEPPAAAQAGESPAMIREQQRYALRLMMQVYDGTRDLSHTQLLGVARLRDGDRSFTQFDYGDGAVVQTGRDGEVAASRFANLSGTERGLTYDYRTRAMSGDSAIAGFHNAVVRPLLGQSPALGRDARWNASLSLAQLGLATAAPASADVRIELSRTYFVHDGQPMVLVHYLVPAFSYVDAQGRSVVHWGEGLSLTDPGFGMVYLNAALHRSVARTADGSVPYRFARAMVAANPDGSAMLDYREVPQLAPYVDRLFGQAAMEVVPTGIASTSSAPIDAARNIDLVALSLGEDGGNEVPMASAAQLSSDRGLELMSAQQAQQMLAIQQQQITAQAMAARSQQTTITNNTNSNVSGRSPQLTSGSGGQSDGIVLSGTTRGGGEGSQSPSGSAANQALGQLGARAVTSDGGIVPGTAGGEQNLAANEAAHLVQNGGSADARSATSSPEGSAAADTLLNGITTRGDAQPAISDVQRIQSVVEYMIENLLPEPGAPPPPGFHPTPVFGPPMIGYNPGNSTASGAQSGMSDTQRIQSVVEYMIENLLPEPGAPPPPGFHPTPVFGPPMIGYNPGNRTADAAQPDLVDALDAYISQMAREAEAQDPRPAVYSDYQTAGQAQQDGPPPWAIPDLEQAAIDRAERSRQAQAELEAYQAQRRAEQLAAQNAGDAELTIAPRVSLLETSELLVSGFGIEPVTFDPVVFDPVTFDPVTWTPPTWTPPEWVPPEFDPPEISRFPATDPDDLDGYPGTGSYPAFTFDSMSGTVETDLSRWQEWLATQDVARLERLARQAGYPNLASALNDADNLLRQAADDGYRAWALAAPSCGGLAGCGPQFGERWAAKRSRLALGDLLAMDRSFFSSAGLTDVQIAGLLLAFTIADFGLEDGDVVTVTVNQFGQTLLSQTLSTTNAGTSFSVPVRPGVVSVQMTAVNEGAIPPNTAGLTIQGVTGGENEQQYSLSTGDTAGLRVTVGN